MQYAVYWYMIYKTLRRVHLPYLVTTAVMSWQPSIGEPTKRSISNNIGVVRTSIVRFHVTSRRPYLCTKQWIGGHVCVQKKNPVGVKLISHVKTFFYSKQFAKQLLLTTWLETIYETAPIQKYRFTAKSLHHHCAISSIVQFSSGRF